MDALQALDVSPGLIDCSVPGTRIPTYSVSDRVSGEIFIFEKLLSGGRPSTPGAPCVALYASKNNKLVVKSLEYDDPSYEESIVATRANECAGAMVPARLAFRGAPPKPGDPTFSKNYSVIVMPYLGDSLARFTGIGAETALGIVKQVAEKCAHLYAAGFAYTDMKPANVLYHSTYGITLCDYGGLAPLGLDTASATYPPPEYPRGLNVPANETTVVYGLGVLLVCLLTQTVEKNIRFISEKAEPNDHLARAALALGCKDAIAAVKRRSNAAARVVAAAWKAGVTLDTILVVLQRY